MKDATFLDLQCLCNAVASLELTAPAFPCVVFRGHCNNCRREMEVKIAGARPPKPSAPKKKGGA